MIHDQVGIHGEEGGLISEELAETSKADGYQLWLTWSSWSEQTLQVGRNVKGTGSAPGMG